jgi:hypothetical protein
VQTLVEFGIGLLVRVRGGQPTRLPSSVSSNHEQRRMRHRTAQLSAFLARLQPICTAVEISQAPRATDSANAPGGMETGANRHHQPLTYIYAHLHIRTGDSLEYGFIVD